MFESKQKQHSPSPGNTPGGKGTFLTDNRVPNVAVQCKANNTGLPDQLKSGIENLSGHSMDDVQVHYNSSQPAQLNAHAYAQGNQIHVAPGQEKHLPHEAWHVVQQKQGRVQPTMQLKKQTDGGDVVQRVVMDAKGNKLGTSHKITNKLTELHWDEEALLFETITSDARFLLTKSSVSFTLNDKGRTAFRKWLQDNQNAEPGLQYKMKGKYANRQGLINSTAAYFKKESADDLKLIEQEVILQEKSKKKMDADDFAIMLQWIMMTDHGWSLPGVSPAVRGEANSGPQIPIFGRVRTQDTEELKKSSHNTFSFGQKTVAQADLIDIKTGKRLTSFVSTSDGIPHAEGVLRENIGQYLRESKIDPGTVRVRITLNNSPCNNTGHECGKMLGRLQKDLGLGGLHVYFANVYGDAEDAGISFEHMKKGGVKLTPFNAADYMHADYKKQAHDKLGHAKDPKSIMPYHAGKQIEDDPFSEDEGEGKKYLGKRDKESRDEYKDEDSLEHLDKRVQSQGESQTDSRKSNLDM